MTNRPESADDPAAAGEFSTIGPRPGAADSVATLLRLRCPHCRRVVELAVTSAEATVDCPECGEPFGVLDEALTAGAADPTHVGHFDLIERVGMGGFGVVWKARDTRLDRLVALKLSRRTHLDEDEAERILREARSAAQMQHPNIVSTFEVGQEDGQLYIATEFVEGATLAESIADVLPRVRDAVRICTAIADALHHAHERGVVHRDLKPHNVMIDDAGAPHLLDFGLAKRETGEVSMTREGDILGTPAYMSPEQARGDGRNVDRRTDVYSLGVVLYQLLTGDLPFRGAPRMLMQQVINDPAPSPRRFDPRVPRDLETITLKCLEKDPARRYRSAEDLRDELRRWSEGRPILARPVSRPEKTLRWIKKNPMPSAVLGLVAVLAVGGPIVAVRQDRLLAERNEQLERSERLAYGSQIGVAFRDLNTGEFQQAKLRLREAARQQEAAQRDHRNWEYHFLRARAEKNFHTHRGIENPVLSVACSPENRWIAWGCGKGDAVVRIANAKTREVVCELTGHEPGVTSLAFEPRPSDDGQMPAIVVGGRDGVIRVWNPNLRERLHRFDTKQGQVWGVAISPDGDRLVAAGAISRSYGVSGAADARVWDLSTGDLVHELPGRTETIWGVAFSPDGRRIATGDDHGIRLWDAASGEEVRLEQLDPTTRRARAVAFDSTGRRVAMGGEDMNVRVIDTATGEQARLLSGHLGAIESVAFLPGGGRLVSSSKDRTIRVWDIDRARPRAVWRGHSDPVPALAVSSDGSLVFSGGRDRTIRVWDATADSDTLEFVGHGEAVRGLAFSADGQRLVAGCEDGGVGVWSLAANRRTWSLRTHGAPLVDVAFDPQEDAVLSTDAIGVTLVQDVATGEVRRRVEPDRGSLTQVALSPDGGRVAYATDDGPIVLQDTASGSLQAASPPEGADPVDLLTFSDDGAVLARRGGAVSRWPARRAAETVLLSDPARLIGARLIVPSPDGSRVLSHGAEGARRGRTEPVRVWDPRSGDVVVVLAGFRGRVRSAAWSNDSQRVLTGGDDGRVRVWDAVSGAELIALGIDAAPVTEVTMDPSGRRVACGREDGSLTVWLTAEGGADGVAATD